MSRDLQLLINSSNGVGLPYEGGFRVDDNVLAQFPEDTIVISASRFGSSGWTDTALLHLRLSDGSEERYFLKSAPGYHGRVMMEGEYNAMTELFKWAPRLVPRPHSWGEYSLLSLEAYFFVVQYIDNTGDMPDANQLCSKLAALHRESQSPNGKFGFHVTTCQGCVPQAVAWQRSWMTFFTQLLKHVTAMDADANGYWEDLDILETRLVAHVIPRLLGALEENGRTIKPCLIHSDLWEGNTATSSQDGNVFIFDSAAFYAHNETEIGSWRCYYNRISDEKYTSAYLRHFEPSEPQEEWADRNKLYSIYYNVIYSVNHLGQGMAVRQRAYLDVYALVDKFAPFPPGEGPPALAESNMVSLSEERDHNKF